MNVNKAIIVGRLTKDPEARTTPNGKAVTSLSVATSQTWTDQSGNKQEKTEFESSDGNALLIARKTKKLDTKELFEKFGISEEDVSEHTEIKVSKYIKINKF